MNLIEIENCIKCDKNGFLPLIEIYRENPSFTIYTLRCEYCNIKYELDKRQSSFIDLVKIWNEINYEKI